MDRMPLLETKLRAPRRRRGVVARPRLTAPVDRRDLPRLTLVSAPAGFGKSTLLAEWFATGASDVAWLALDRRDDDPTVLWTYVAAAVDRMVAGAAGAVEALGPGAAPESIAAALLNALAPLDDDVVLVIDDLHLVASTAIHESLVFLLEHLPDEVHLVVGTRVDPPWPLPTLRARGDLREVRAADLRFTEAEASAYLASMGVELTSGDVALLEERTEGWIAALQLAALSLQGRDDVSDVIEGFAGDDRFVLDYLASEVLDHQTAEVRRFLLDTSILHRLTGPLCDAVTGEGGARATLAALEGANLFVVALDERRDWYRYHHLFADVLRARLLDEEPAAVRTLHRRAADWWAANGDRAEAVRHALAADDLDLAADLIERALPPLRQARQEATYRPWLEALPPEVFDDRPVLTMGLVGARMVSGEPAGVAELLDGVERQLLPTGELVEGTIVIDEAERPRLPAQIAMYRSALALLRSDVSATIDHAERARKATAVDDHVGHGAATALQGLALWSVGDLGTAAERYREAIEHFERAEHHADLNGVARALADIEVGRGRLGAAVRVLEDALARSRRHGPLRGEADVLVGLADVAHLRGDLTAASEHLTAADAVGHQALPPFAHRSRVARARLLAVSGDADGALELFDEAVELYDTDLSPPIDPPAAARARLQVAIGAWSEAAAWAERAGLAPDVEVTYVRAAELLVLARVLLAQGRGAAARRLLDRLVLAADDGGWGSGLEGRVVLAATHLAAGDRAAAGSALRDALRRSEPEGVARPFLDEGDAVRRLLSEEAEGGRGPASDRARRVLVGVPDRTRGERRDPTPSGLVEELSPRELDVLRLLRGELSGPDIARELLVSLNTFRTHTRNIYAKLGVTSRRAAVRRAEELRL